MKTNKLPLRTFQGVIIERMLGSREALVKFAEEYKEHCYVQRYPEPTAQDYKIADMWGKHMLVREISQRLGISQNKVNSAIRRVAHHKLMESYQGKK